MRSFVFHHFLRDSPRILFFTYLPFSFFSSTTTAFSSSLLLSSFSSRTFILHLRSTEPLCSFTSYSIRAYRIAINGFRFRCLNLAFSVLSVISVLFLAGPPFGLSTRRVCISALCPRFRNSSRRRSNGSPKGSVSRSIIT